MYEYATMAIDDKYCGASLVVTKIAVGPSAPPMIPIADATFASNGAHPKQFLPKIIAPIKVMKIAARRRVCAPRHPALQGQGLLMNVIELNGVGKTFRDFWLRPTVKAVDGLDLAVAQGELSACRRSCIILPIVLW